MNAIQQINSATVATLKALVKTDIRYKDIKKNKPALTELALKKAFELNVETIQLNSQPDGCVLSELATLIVATYHGDYTQDHSAIFADITGLSIEEIETAIGEKLATLVEATTVKVKCSHKDCDVEVDVDKDYCEAHTPSADIPHAICYVCESQKPQSDLYKVGEQFMCKEDCSKDPIIQARRTAAAKQTQKQEAATKKASKVSKPRKNCDDHILIPGDYGRSQKSTRFTLYCLAVENTGSSILDLHKLSGVELPMIRDAVKKMVNDKKATLLPPAEAKIRLEEIAKNVEQMERLGHLADEDNAA